MIRYFNTTHLDKNGHILFAQDCDVLGVVEHKLNKEQGACWMGRFRDARWNFMPSPADERSKTPLAGVGVGSRNHITQINNPIKTENFRQMNEAGRLNIFVRRQLGNKHSDLCGIWAGRRVERCEKYDRVRC